MGKWIQCLLVFILIWSNSFAQRGTETLPKGARSAGMGNANLSLSDAWSIFNNVGALARITQSQAAFGFDHRLQLNELTTLAAVAALKSDWATFGLGVSSYGSEIFSQNQVGLGISNQLGIASLGVKFNYFQTSIEGLGTGRTFMVELGGLAELTPELFFGAHIYNPFRASYGKNSPDFLPTLVKAGITYKPFSSLLINLEAEKDILLPPLFKLGMEYGLGEKIWLRSGIHTNPSNVFFGIGFRPKRFHFDYAMGQNLQLGYTHHFSFNYLFGTP